MTKFFKSKSSTILSFPFLLISVLLVVMGIYGVAALGDGLFLLVIGLIGLLLKKGIIINIEERKIKEYWGILGIEFGKWQILPQAKIITIVRMVERREYNVPAGGAQSFSSKVVFKLKLKIDEKNRILISEGNYDSIIEEAKELAKKLSLDILDCSSKERKLIKHTN